jgi:ABC-type multidrug transport system ATPase subunit
MDDAAISARGLTKAFGATRVLTGVDLTVPPGTLVALLGPNGSARRPRAWIRAAEPSCGR